MSFKILYVGFETEILWKHEDHTRYEYTKLGFVESEGKTSSLRGNRLSLSPKGPENVKK